MIFGPCKDQQHQKKKKKYTYYMPPSHKIVRKKLGHENKPKTCFLFLEDKLSDSPTWPVPSCSLDYVLPTAQGNVRLEQVGLTDGGDTENNLLDSEEKWIMKYGSLLMFGKLIGDRERPGFLYLLHIFKNNNK